MFPPDKMQVFFTLKNKDLSSHTENYITERDDFYSKTSKRLSSMRWGVGEKKHFLAKAAHCCKFCFPHHKGVIFTNKGRVTGNIRADCFPPCYYRVQMVLVLQAPSTLLTSSWSGCDGYAGLCALLSLSLRFSSSL